MISIQLGVLHAQDRLPEELNGLEVFVDVAPEQPLGHGGLVFALRLANSTDHAIAVKNPYDLLTYKLTDAEGWPVSLRAPSSKGGKVHGKVGDNRASYLAVQGISAAGAAVDVAAETVAKTVSVPAGASYVYALKVERLAAPPNAPDGPTTFVAGEYGFKCQVPLLFGGAATPPGATLASEPTTITFR